MNYSKELINEVIQLYNEAKLIYQNCKKPANYIPNWIKKRVDQKISTMEIYCIINHLSEIPRCIVCGKPSRFIDLFKGFKKTCCLTCARSTNEFKNALSNKNKGRCNPNKGKTYKEIYGNRQVKCGFQKGENNIAKRPEIRAKISRGVKNSYIKNNGALRKRRSNQALAGKFSKILPKKKYFDKVGNLYRSRLEAGFANVLLKEHIPFQYEVPIKMQNNHNKIVDFVIDGNLFVEISGYAYEGWKQDFDLKMKIFDESRDVNNSIILILTYPDKLEELQQRQAEFKNQHDNLFYDSIENENHFLRGIKFYRSILLANRYLNGD